MRSIPILIATALLAPAVATAGVRKPWRPPPPTPNWATAPDDLVGRWSVYVIPFVSSCTATSRHSETWEVTLANGTFTITTSDHQTFEGPATTRAHSNLEHSLQTKRQPGSSAVLKLHHSLHDRFFATIVRGESGTTSSDPMCVAQYTITGTRVRQ